MVDHAPEGNSVNSQQARIEALLSDAADEFEADGSVSLTVQTSLAQLGYDLRHLDDDINDILN